MTINISNNELTALFSVLNKCSDVEISNVKASYRLSKIIGALESSIKDSESFREKLLKKHSKKDEDGNPVVPKDEKGVERPGMISIENPEEFQKELNAFFEEKIDVELPTKLSLTLLSETSELKLTAADMLSLDPILEDDLED